MVSPFCVLFAKTNVFRILHITSSDRRARSPELRRPRNLPRAKTRYYMPLASQLDYHANEFRMPKVKNQLLPPGSAVAARKLKTATATRRTRSQPQNVLKRQRKRKLKLTLNLHPRKSLCPRRSVASVSRRKRNLMRISRPIRRMR